MAHKYSDSTGKILYEPKNTNHKAKDLYGKKKYEELMKKINSLDCDEELRKLLEFRASQFVIFKFDKIADYYAYQATKEEQNIMEDLALVLLDKDALIEHGFSDIVEDL